MPSKRRFIAGAVCPECRAVDRVCLEEVDGQPTRLCVSCGFTETMKADVSVAEPSTRLRRSATEAEASPVKILLPDDPTAGG